MIVSAISVFEKYSQYKDFKDFCYEDTKGFQKYVLNEYSHTIQTANRVMFYVREFFLWLREHNGYKKIKFDDADDLQLSRKDKEKATVVKPKDCLNIQTWQELILNLEPKSDQDARHVSTKFGKSQKTNLWNLKPQLRQILDDWIKELINKHGFTNQDPVFPKIKISTNEQNLFQNDGFLKERIHSQTVLRDELYKQLKKAGVGHYTPHTIRNSIISLFHSLSLTLEQQKSISQNMSHQHLGTTIGYCSVSEYRQDELIKGLNIEQLIKQKELQDDQEYQYVISKMNDK